MAAEAAQAGYQPGKLAGACGFSLHHTGCMRAA
jgi:hypothetical protein